ncbi:MAG: ABC-F family ATP-binding cassette domain-containing protein [Bacteroidetes bacterium]|nr:ABC-F family ATP-binding cassette domain-containing protein [Bacteroidota bacterium]
MPVLSVNKVSKDFRYKPLFSDVTFSIDWSERLGLIGTNGSGKSTLMRIVSGEVIPDSGEVVVAESSHVGYLPQNPIFDPEHTVLDAIFSRNSEALSLIHDYEQACEDLIHSHGDAAVTRRVTELAAKLDAAGAWDVETNAKVILSKLGITDLTAKMGTLSGGQRKRVALAHALIVQPDLLMLDEPTNHLDAETISWLEQYLKRYSGALLLVTHDRYFLDRVTDHILEVDRGTTQVFNGNYQYYLERKAEQEELRKVEGQKRRSLAKRELAWLKRGAKARTTKQKARVDRATELINTPQDQEKEVLELKIAPRKLGSKVVDFEKVTKSFGDKVLLKDFTYSVTKGERIGIIGPNGSGKTTLLEMISERMKPTSGKIEVGSSVVIGYYDQESRDLNENSRVIDYIKEIGENLPTADGGTISASQMLERFLFAPEMQYSVIGKLSGGERRRLYLLRLLMTNPNVLLLDEPTNDLDIPTLVALESFLDDFEGTLVVVSHDRYFLDRTIDHIFRFEGEGRIREYPGDYSAFLEIRDREEREAEEHARSQSKKQAASATQEPAKKAKLSFKEQKEFEQLEKDIPTAEARKAELESQLSNAGSDYELIQTVSNELGALSTALDAKVERWMELAEFAK